jgi:predicted RNase H-like nuclease (RuvC/YqgF family)
MASKKSKAASDDSFFFPPAGTPEERENQLIALVYEAVEERIRNGTASSAEYVHFLKAGSSKQKEEIDKLQKENEMLRAKTEALRSEKNREELYKQAIAAMRSYSPSSGEDDYDDSYLY